MKSFNTLTSFSLLSLQSLPAFAYWRMACGVSQTSRIDPILSPGSISGHVHKFAGGNSMKQYLDSKLRLTNEDVNQFSTHESLVASTCSTCEVQSDKSAYWTPQLYYEHADGTIEEVQNDGMTVYYVGRGGNPSNTVPFPDGFKMISGNSLTRYYDDQNLTYLDTRPIADRSCWDGVNLYSPGSSHVAYLSGIDYGVCPPSHPVPIPGLFYEVLYWTNRINQSTGGRFVFANGDATGYGFHGDFMNGWDQDAQVRAVQQCLYTDNGGNVLACPALAESADPDFARKCPASPSIFSEVVQGILPEKRLPGCNPISTGPNNVQQIACPANVAMSSTQSSLTPSSSSSSTSTSATPVSSSSSSSSRSTLSSSRSQVTTRSTTFSTVSTSQTSAAIIDSSNEPSTAMAFNTTTAITSNRQTPGVFVTALIDASTSDATPSQTSDAATSADATPAVTESNSAVSTTLVTFLPVVVFNSTEVVEVGNVTVTTVVVRTSTLQPSEYCSMFPENGLTACETISMGAATTLDATTTTDASTETGTETQTSFITVYSPLTLNVTSVTDVTVTATQPAKLRRNEAVTYRLRGRQIVKTRA